MYRKTVYTLNVNGYNPEITAITYPLIKRWADKIRADFYVINTRRWPSAPPVYEKLQIYYLAESRSDDWSIFVDSDAIIHPDLWDPTEHISKDIVMHNGSDFANIRWRYDKYFRRDGRNIGSCNWFTIASDWCRDLWHPLEDITLEEAFGNIFPIQNELNTVVTREHLIDDYVLSRNIAKYGLKFATLIDQQNKLFGPNGNFLWHVYDIPEKEKVAAMKDVIVKWGIANAK